MTFSIRAQNQLESKGTFRSHCFRGSSVLWIDANKLLITKIFDVVMIHSKGKYSILRELSGNLGDKLLVGDTFPL